MNTHTTYLVGIECFKCGAVFGVSRERDQRNLATGRTFWCSACGKSQCYMETENDRLKRELEAERRMKNSARERCARMERSRAAVKGQLTKTKNRIAKGVCPCCKRSFVNLERHMAGQHPNYAATEEKT